MARFLLALPPPAHRLVIACAAGLLSVAAQALDLNAAYQLAEKNDPVFQSARFALAAAEQKLPQARAGLLPVLAANGNKNSTSANTAFTDVEPVVRNARAWQWNLQLTQPLFRLDNYYAWQAAGYEVAQAEAQFVKAQQDMLLRVADAYYSVLVAQEALTAADAQVAALQEQLDQVQRGFDKGTHAITDVDDTRSRLGSAQSAQIAAQNEVDNKRADLEKSIGQEPDTLSPLPDGADIPLPEPKDAKAWVDNARQNNPAVQAQRAALAAAEAEFKRARAGHAPTVDLVGSYGANASSNSLTTPDDYATRAKSREIGVQVSFPLFSGGAVSSKITEAEANLHKAQADLEAETRQAATDARQAYAGVVNGKAQIDALNTAITAGLNAIKGNQAGYKLGLRINLDVLNSQQQLFGARKDLAKAKYDAILAGMKLRAAVGGGRQLPGRITNVR